MNCLKGKDGGKEVSQDRGTVVTNVLMNFSELIIYVEDTDTTHLTVFRPFVRKMPALIGTSVANK